MTPSGFNALVNSELEPSKNANAPFSYAIVPTSAKDWMLAGRRDDAERTVPPERFALKIFRSLTMRKADSSSFAGPDSVRGGQGGKQNEASSQPAWAQTVHDE